MKEQLRFWLVTFVLALMTFSVGVSLYWSLRGMFWGVSNGIYVEKRGESYVLQVGDASIVGGALKDGDEIITFNGEPFTSVAQDVLATYRAKPGDTYTITVRREGQTLPEMRLPFVRWSQPLPRRLQTLEQNVLLPIISLLIGLVVFALKPQDRQAVVLAVMLALFANSFSQGAQTGFAPFVYPYWLLLLVALAWLVSDAFSPALLHLFLIFPQTSPLVKRFQRLTIYVYLLFFLLSTPFTLILVWLRFFEPEAAFNPAKDYPILSYVSLAQFLGYLVAALVAAIVSYRQADKLARRKLRVVLSGTLIAFAPLVILIVLELSAEKLGFTSPATNQAWSMWVGVFLYATPPLMPLAFAYSIARHKVIPVSLIIRRGVRYLLVSGGSIGLQIILLSLLMPVLMYSIFRFVLRTSNPAIVGMVSSGIAILVWNVMSALNSRVIGPAIDRRFFREAYNAQAILAELGGSVRRVTDVRELLALVATAVEAALHVESVTIFLRDPATGDFVRELWSKHDGTGKMNAIAEGAREVTFARDSFVVKKLDAARAPLEVDFADADSWVNEARQTFAFEDEPARGELEILRGTNAALLLPLETKEELLGFIALGSRLGDLPFSGEDKQLLSGVASQMTLALENARLVERMIVEGRRRQEIEAENERRAQELEEARQLQLSMLPRTLPQLPHLEIAAYMKPALEVGGDYYDFHVSEDGTLTVALGDATGHGLKAGSMVTATKSLFNAFAHEPSITQFFTKSSQALKRMNLRSLYMAMTVIKVKENCLTISAAGMPPVLIYRAPSGTIEEVSIRAMPLGSVASFPYQQQELHLSPGDAVLLMSDGFPERFNEQGEMLDYERAKTVLQAIASHSSQEIVDRFVRDGDEWGGAHPQDDDVTFVVLKVRDGN